MVKERKNERGGRKKEERKRKGGRKGGREERREGGKKGEREKVRGSNGGRVGRTEKQNRASSLLPCTSLLNLWTTESTQYLFAHISFPGTILRF
jgi:hypothetical protein